MTDSGLNVMVVGESWMVHSIHQKGFDSFTTTAFGGGLEHLERALVADGISVTQVPCHRVPEAFPGSVEGLREFDAIVLSDVGANTLLLSPDTFERGRRTVNRLELIAEYARAGGGFGMIGGYLSFQGIEAKANYRNTPLADVLPVTMEEGDDRAEAPQGIEPRLDGESHPVTEGLPERLPHLLGYNRLSAKPEATVLLRCAEHPLLTVGAFGEGRTFAYASDCGPHWVPDEASADPSFALQWTQTIRWLAGAL